MRQRGETIVLITHKLDEVMEISDAITVMRHGKTVDRLVTSSTSPQEIARAMVGRDVQLAMNYVADDMPVTPTEERIPRADALLDVRDLVVEDVRRLTAVNGVSFQVRAGEILGIAGVEGNGQTELIEAIAGLRAPRSGSILLGTRDATAMPVKARGDAGLSHVPEDRHARGLILDYTIAENLILGQQHHFTRGTRLDSDKILENAKRQIETFDIRPADPALPARALSGGNQQKIVIAKWLATSPKVIILDEPTKGIDIGSKAAVHAFMGELVAQGLSVIMVSSELPEILGMSDRVVVLREGRMVAVYNNDGLSAETLVRTAAGIREDAA